MATQGETDTLPLMKLFYIGYDFPLFSMSQWDTQLEPWQGQDQGETPRVRNSGRQLLSGPRKC